MLHNKFTWLVASALLLSLLVFYRYQSSDSKGAPPKQLSVVDRVLQSDIDVIRSWANSDEDRLSLAITRLSRSAFHQEVLSQQTSFKDHKSEKVRAAIDEATRFLSQSETGSHGDKSQSTRDEMKEIDKKLRGADPAQAEAALLRWIEIEPNNQRLKSYLQVVVKSSAKPSLKIIAFRHLAMLRESLASEKLTEMLESKNEELSLVGVQSIHLLCPANRWELLKKYVSDRSEEKLLNAAAHEAWLLNEDNSDSFLAAIAQAHEGNSLLIRNIRSLKNKQNKISRPCP